MLNIFVNETIYGGWQKKECVKLEEAMPKDLYDSMDEVAEVTESDKGYGPSVCFFLNHGANRVYKALSTQSALKVGDKIKKSECFVTVLSKQGGDDIYRISEKAE